MNKVKLEELIQDFAREANLLAEFVTIIKSFSDYLFFNVVFSEILTSRVKLLNDFTKIDDNNLTIFNNSYGNILNRLGDWVNQNTYTGGFTSKSELSDNLISKFTVKNKTKLIKLLNEAERKLETKYKVEISSLINSSQKSLLTSSLLNLKGINKTSINNLVIGYTSSCIFRYPALALTLDKKIINDLIKLKENPFQINYKINDPEIQNGFKKPVIIDLQLSTLNSFINFISELLSGLSTSKHESFEAAKECIMKMNYCYSSTDDLPLPEKDKLNYDKSFNYHSILAAVNVGQKAGQGHLIIMSLPGDVQSRKFFINLPTDYTFFSSVSNLVRAQEYQQAPPAFTIKHASERQNSIRVNGMNRLLNELDDIEKELLLSDNIEKLLLNLKITTKDAAEASATIAITYLVTKIFETGEPVPQALAAGIIDYIKNTIIK